MVGIIIAIVLRGLFIWLGAAAIERFSWVFYIFGAFLLYTAWKLAREGESDDDEYEENRFMKFVESRFPATKEYDGTKLFSVAERQAAGHPDVLRHHRPRHDRPALRARLDPGDLRADQGAVHRAHRQPLRADGAAPALLPASAACSSGWSTSASAWPCCSPSSASSCCCTPCTTNELPFINGGEHVPRAGDPDLDVARGHRRSSSAPRRSLSLMKTRRDDREARARTRLEVLRRSGAGRLGRVLAGRPGPGPGPMPRRPGPCPAAGSGSGR